MRLERSLRDECSAREPLMHLLERETALDLCGALLNSDRFLDESELRGIVTHGGYCEADEYRASLAYALRERWIRLAHVRPTLTLTSLGMSAIGR